MEAWARLMRTTEDHEDECFECSVSACPEPVRDVGEQRLAVVKLEETWRAMMTERGEDANIPDLWRLSVLLENVSQGRGGADDVEAGRDQ